MNFAKKTMSLALASVMAASSLFVGSTAFAATDKVIKPMTGNTQVVTATVKDTINKYGYHDYDVDSSVYAYTPAKTGYYAISVKSTPVYEKETTKTYTQDGTTYTNKDYEYSYTNSAEFSKRVDDASVTVYDNNNLSSKGELAYIDTVKNVLSYTQKDENSYPQDATAEYFDGYDVVKLNAGKTYYFDVYTDAYSNAVANSATYERTFLSGATVTVAPTDWDYELVKTKVSSQTFKIKSENETYTKQYNYYKLGASTKYLGTAKDAVVPNTINSLPVTEVNGTQNKAITSLTLSANVKSVSNFDNLKNLAAINLSNVETVKSHAFAGDTALTSVAIPATVKEVKESAFYGCTALANVSVAYGVKEIGDYAFYETAAKSIALPSTIVSIGDYAFGYETGLNTNTVNPYDTTEVAKQGFVMSGYSSDAALNYAVANDMAYYELSAGCPHPYEVTTVPATIFAKGSKTSVCPICGATTVKSIKKKTFKISSVKSSKKKTLVVKAAKQKEMAGYKVQYSTSKKFTKKTTKTVKVATKKALNKTVKGLKSGKKYYVRVRAYKVADGKTVNSAWTKTKSVKVK